MPEITLTLSQLENLLGGPDHAGPGPDLDTDRRNVPEREALAHVQLLAALLMESLHNYDQESWREGMALCSRVVSAIEHQAKACLELDLDGVEAPR